ncbi:MAG: hypothetical protein KHX03_02605 [Clostridium sp.]|nr:hypothetical protein [Clostridium sp.]
MVNSVSSLSSSSSVQSTNQLSEEEKKKKKTEEDGLFSEDTQQTTQDNTSSTLLSEDTTKSTARSYIASLKAQYPQLASKLDSYLSNLDFTTLCSEATSVSDVKAYIYSETQGLFK